jgi:SAM-dependent MidA family methyltransferase
MSTDPSFSQRLHQSHAALAEMPAPDAVAAAHSDQLATVIREEIDRQGGAIPFRHFMQLALYAPGLGYYSAGSRKLGPEGDFITAPEVAPLFSRTLAHAVAPVLKALSRPAILEVGAGSGRMAADLLAELTALGSEPVSYSILEVSAELQTRQQATLQQHNPAALACTDWLTSWPENFTGIVLANELLDAMPVHRLVRQQGSWQESYVGLEQNQFVWRSGPLSVPELQTRLDEIDARVDLPDDYVTEINLAAEDWVRALAGHMTQGLVLLIDYGFARHEYYHPQRQQGTLMCHYRHRAHDDPFYRVGLQDITAHVEFTAIADSSLQAGLKITGYTTQAHFLLGSGLTELIATAEADTEAHLAIANQVRRLTLPQEMGELFKVMGLTKNLAVSLPGFALRDLRGKL